MTVEAITCTSVRRRRRARWSWRLAVMRAADLDDAAIIALAWTIENTMPEDGDCLSMPLATIAILASLTPADADAAMARLERAGLVIRSLAGIHLACRTPEDRA
ncbi:hypothetical protein ACQVP2_28250 [Methylobacterium aquaticum]|uniref:hypothetical protein n=1 Tax=Methylobacterium aquaticum TaxID=270351 RepID=UPI003D1798D6